MSRHRLAPNFFSKQGSMRQRPPSMHEHENRPPMSCFEIVFSYIAAPCAQARLAHRTDAAFHGEPIRVSRRHHEKDYTPPRLNHGAFNRIGNGVAGCGLDADAAAKRYSTGPVPVKWSQLLLVRQRLERPGILLVRLRPASRLRMGRRCRMARLESRWRARPSWRTPTHWRSSRRWPRWTWWRRPRRTWRWSRRRPPLK